MNRESGHSPRTVGPGLGGLRAGVVDVVDVGRRVSAPVREWLSGQASRAMGELGAEGDVRVRIVGDEEMAAAHERFGKVAGTTDVLTFDLVEEPGLPLDADILVCVDEAGRQAGARGHTVERELLLYVIHGVLHCLGHDDHDEAGAARMHTEEDRVLEALGVGATYLRAENGPQRGGARECGP